MELDFEVGSSCEHLGTLPPTHKRQTQDPLFLICQDFLFLLQQFNWGKIQTISSFLAG